MNAEGYRATSRESADSADCAEVIESCNYLMPTTGTKV